MDEVIVTVSLDGRKGLMEIQDKPYKFKSDDYHKDRLINYFQNVLNFHTERYPGVCKEFVKNKGYEEAQYIKLSITGGIFKDEVVSVQSKIGGDVNEEKGPTDTSSI